MRRHTDSLYYSPGCNMTFDITETQVKYRPLATATCWHLVLLLCYVHSRWHYNREEMFLSLFAFLPLCFEITRRIVVLVVLNRFNKLQVHTSSVSNVDTAQCCIMFMSGYKKLHLLSEKGVLFLLREAVVFGNDSVTCIENYSGNWPCSCEYACVCAVVVYPILLQLLF